MYLQNCYPSPVHLSEDNSRGYVFGAQQTLMLSTPITEDIGRRMRALWHRFTCTAGTLELAVPFVLRPSGGTVTATLGDNPPECALEAGMRYAVKAVSDGITLCAADEKALMEGFCTLVQMIVPENLHDGEERFFIADKTRRFLRRRQSRSV